MAPSLSHAQGGHGSLPTKDYRDKVLRLKAPSALSFRSISFWGGEVSCFFPQCSFQSGSGWVQLLPAATHGLSGPARGDRVSAPPLLPSCTLTQRQEGHWCSLGSSQGAARGLGNGRHPGGGASAAGLRQGLLAGLWEQDVGALSAVPPPPLATTAPQLGDGLPRRPL